MNCDLNFNNKLTAIKVEHDACHSDNDNDVKLKLKKLNNYVKCENKCFDTVDKWINKAIVKVPTGDNWHNIIQREIALLKVRYPFLTEKQLKGKALVKFGIPCLMGDVIRTGDKKVTGALAKELLRTRERKTRIPAAFKVVKKVVPFVKKLKSSSPPTKIQDYLESNSDKKLLEMANKSLQTPDDLYSKYAVPNPYYSDKENSCPPTPKKRKIYDPVTSSWNEVNDDEQTPTKKIKLTPLKPENKKYLVPITQAAKQIMTLSPESEASPQSEEECSQSSLKRELLEKLKKYPFTRLIDLDSKKQSSWQNDSEVEILQDKTNSEISQSQEISTIDIDTSPIKTEYVPSPETSQSLGVSTIDIDVTPPSQSIASQDYSWSAGQSISKLVSQPEFNSVRRSFERLSFSESDSPIISPMGVRTQCLSINSDYVVSPLTQNSLPTPILLSQNELPASFDHDYAKNQTQQVTPGFSSSSMASNSQMIPGKSSTFSTFDELTPLDSSEKSSVVEVFTPPSPLSRDVSLLTPRFPNSPAKNTEKEFSDDEFSDNSELSQFPLLSDCCDEFSEGWKKVLPRRLVPPSTDIREKMKTVSMKEIKEQVLGIINFLDGDDADDN